MCNAAHLISYTHATERFGVGLIFLFGLNMHSKSNAKELLWRLFSFCIPFCCLFSYRTGIELVICCSLLHYCIAVVCEYLLSDTLHEEQHN